MNEDELNGVEITITIGQLREQLKVIAEERDDAIDEARRCLSHSLSMQDKLVSSNRRHEVALNEVRRLELRCRKLEEERDCIAKELRELQERIKEAASDH